MKIPGGLYRRVLFFVDYFAINVVWLRVCNPSSTSC